MICIVFLNQNIEEFYAIWKLFSEGGYEVIAFEGLGQGGTLHKYHLPFDHAWEKPTSAILDYFNIPDATILGISMGGYWCLRAAAFEKRIRRVIVFPPLLDWMESTNGAMRGLVNFMMKYACRSDLVQALGLLLTFVKSRI